MNFLKSLLAGSGNAVTATDAKPRIDNKQLFVLDVRQPDEFQLGHIAGANLIPLGDLPRRLDELPKEGEILCVCRSGSRSSIAAGQLTRLGFNALNLRGGMIAWLRDGYPVKKGK